MVEGDNSMQNTLLEKCLEEEKKLQFDSFSHKDALNLGLKILAKSKGYPGPVAIEITINGLIVFCYYPDGTGEFHEMWLKRKSNMVRVRQMSTLRAFAELEHGKEDMEKDWLLSSKEYAGCGGGFPIKIKKGSVIGAVCVSGLPHLLDHEILSLGIQDFLNVYIDKQES